MTDVRLEPWRTVDDIPRDGTSVDLLLSSGREVSCAYWGEMIGGEEEGWFVGENWARGEDEEVIRWRPYRSPLSASRTPPAGEPVADGFTPEDFSAALSPLLSAHAGIVQAGLSNNINVIIAALRRAAAPPASSPSVVTDEMVEAALAVERPSSLTIRQCLKGSGATTDPAAFMRSALEAALATRSALLLDGEREPQDQYDTKVIADQGLPIADQLRRITAVTPYHLRNAPNAAALMIETLLAPTAKAAPEGWMLVPVDERKHTPGPWRPAGRNGGWDGVDAEDGTMICHLEFNNPANGALIAAAPTLLAELSAAVGYMRNAKIDLETGASKATAIRTIEGGIKRAEAALRIVT